MVAITNFFNRLNTTFRGTRRDQMGLTPDQAERHAWRERPGRSRHNLTRRMPAWRMLLSLRTAG